MPPAVVVPLQLDIHKSAPKGPHSFAQQQLLAEAAVAVAFQRKQPLLLLQAASAFEKLEQAAAAAQVGGLKACSCRVLSCPATCSAQTEQAQQTIPAAPIQQREGAQANQ